MPAAPQPEIDPRRKTCYNRNIQSPTFWNLLQEELR